MKKAIRKVHIDGMEWHYIMGCNGVAKVFPPNSKTCIAEVDAVDAYAAAIDDPNDPDGFTHPDVLKPTYSKDYFQHGRADHGLLPVSQCFIPNPGCAIFLCQTQNHSWKSGAGF